VSVIAGRIIVAPPAPGLDAWAQAGQWQSVAVVAAGFVFCSGIVAVDPGTGERLNGTVASETRQCFENLRLVLEAAGSSLDRLVQVHALIHDRIEYDNLNRVYRDFVPDAPPVRTAWDVRIEHGFKVALDATALAGRRGEGATP
jgi:2-iminobutanoate/2-iminopropanoate deaminase